MRTRTLLQAVPAILLSLTSLRGTASPIAFTPVSHTNAGGYGLSIAVAGNYAYVANNDDGLRIFDVSNPANPLNVGHVAVSAGDYAYDVVVSGGRAFMAGYNSGLSIFDISNPVSPVLVARTNDGGGDYRIALSGNYCYVGALGSGVHAYDISDLSHPIHLGSTNNGVVYGLAVSNNLLFSAGGFGGLFIYDISNPGSPSLVGHGTLGGDASSVVIRGDKAFVGNAESGLAVYGISDPANPTVVNAGTGDAGPIHNLVLSRNYACVAEGGGGVSAYDIADPANPFKAGTVADGSDAEGIAIVGNYAYVADGSGLRIYSIQPELQIHATGTNTLVLSWADTAPFAVQQSSGLVGAWTTLTNVPATIGSRCETVVPVPAGPRFYRLISQ